MGHEVHASSSAEQGLDDASTFLPELVMLDIRLPGLGGIEALQLFQKQLPDSPVIMISAFGDLEMLEAVKQDGSAGFLKNPSRWRKPHSNQSYSRIPLMGSSKTAG